MSNTISPNMNLVVPGIGTEESPTWASDLNSSLSIVDEHNHSPGSGVQITPNGIDINIDLPYNGNNAIGLRSARFNAQSAPLSGASDLGCVYVSGADLYYNDENGNQVKITSGGSVNATSSGISSGTATASFVAGVLVVDEATNTPANIQAGSILLGNNTAGSDFITLSPPNSLATNYSITLPLLPASNLPVSINSSGSMSAAAITYNQLATAVQQIINTPPTVQRFTSGSGTYTTPIGPSPLYIRVRMVGGGGGGAGTSNASGSNGTNTTFGLSTAGAGSGGGTPGQLQQPGIGGNCTLGVDATSLVINVSGGQGGSGGIIASAGVVALSGGVGGNSIFGGSGGAGGGSAGTGISGTNAATNSGSGGGGGGGNDVIANQTGGGGGAGGCLEFIINSPSATYSYAIGSGGAGAAGAGSQGSGGNGAAGIIIVEEFYGA